MKFVKYSWGLNEDGDERYVIVQPLDSDHYEVQQIIAEARNPDDDYKDGVWGRLVYGSRCEYLKRSRVFFFNNVETITELDHDAVLQEHFVGML